MTQQHRVLGVRNKRVLTVATAILAFLLVPGCSVGPNYERSQVALPTEWKEAHTSGIVTAPAADLSRWWTSFNDPMLDWLIERAADFNLDLRTAESRIREARAARAVTAAAGWPGIDVAASYSRNRVSENSLLIPSPEASRNVLPSTVRDIEHDLFRFGLDTTWEIDMFGGVRRAIEAADAGLEATVEDRRDVLVTLLGDVAKNYIDFRAFQRRLQVVQEHFQAQKEILDLTQIRFQAGLASDLDVARAEAQVKQTEAEIPVLESALKQNAYRLDVLLGLQAGSLWTRLFTAAAIPTLPPEVLAGLPSELLRRRPDIRRAERQLAAATAQVGVAVADLFPKFFLTGVAGLQSVSASDWLTGGSRFWSIGPTLSWRIFDSGRVRAKIEVFNAQQEQALIQYEKTVLVALQEVETALVNYANEQGRHRSLHEAVAAHRRAVEMANELYLRGLVDFLNVLDAQRVLYSTENDLARSEGALASNLVFIYRALGGGWETP